MVEIVGFIIQKGLC